VPDFGISVPASAFDLGTGLPPKLEARVKRGLDGLPAWSVVYVVAVHLAERADDLPDSTRAERRVIRKVLSAYESCLTAAGKVSDLNLDE
jgi:hypothetical protein